MTNAERIMAAIQTHVEVNRAALDATVDLVNVNFTVWLKPHDVEVTMRPETRSKQSVVQRSA